jgi:hypothetical protein
MPVTAAPPDIVLAFTACSRPGYLRRTLDSWEKVRGIEGVPVLFRAEPGFPAVHVMCREAFGGRGEVHVNPRRLGEAENQWHAVEAGFKAGAGFVILAEDDDEVSTDVLEYFTWAAARFRGRADVLTAATFRHHRVPGGPAGVQLAGYFPCNVWGIWRDRWDDVVRDDWRASYLRDGWDTRLNKYWVQERGWKVALPCESRSQNFGEAGGAHGDGPRGLSDCWAAERGPHDYAEVTGE